MPARVGENQLLLRIQDDYGEDVEAEEEFEPHSFLARRKPIAPGATATGTVVFEVPRTLPR